MYKAEKIVEVEAFHKGEKTVDRLGWTWKDIFLYNKVMAWVPTGKREKLFGRVDRWGYMTHMSYSLSTHRHSNWNDWYDNLVERAKNPTRRNPESPDWQRFYFDAGSNGHPIYVEMNELKRAMIELGLYHD